MAEQERRRIRRVEETGTSILDSSASPEQPQADSTYNPERLARWTELHRKVDELPPEEREVYELRYYAGLTLAEVADSLQIHPKQASRLWIRDQATRKGASRLPRDSLRTKGHRMKTVVERLTELLVEWDYHHEQGTDPSPEELCPDDLELREAVRARLAEHGASSAPSSPRRPAGKGRRLLSRYPNDP